MGQTYFGINEPTRNESLIVTNSSSIVSEARNQDNERKVITIRNISDDDTKIVTINLGSNLAVANQGIVLRRNESFSDSSETGYKCWQGVITGICAVASATPTLSIFER